MKGKLLLVLAGVLCAGLVLSPGLRAQIDPPTDPNCPAGSLDCDPNGPVDPNGPCDPGDLDCDPNQPCDPSNPDCDPNGPPPPPVGDSACSCTNSPASRCVPTGHRVTLTGFSIDQDAGESVWTYRVCNESGIDGSNCQPLHPLAVFSLGLPRIGDCLNTEQSVTMVQVGGFSSAQVLCHKANLNNSCGISGLFPEDHLEECNFIGGNGLDAGECIDLQLRISGEMPTVGAGFSRAIAGEAGVDTGCIHNCIQGPSCHPCTPPPPPDVDECLTRTRGFWGTHPHITQLFGPINVCGQVLNSVEGGLCNSFSEALCTSGKDSKDATWLQFIAQLTAAKLNLAASDAVMDGSCGEEAEELIARCESLGCGGNKKAITASGCIESLTAFNESLDAIGSTLPPFTQPGPANVTECQEARGNGLAILRTVCAP